MRICKNCNVKMEKTTSFAKDKCEKFYNCPICYFETKHRKLRDNELDFGEVLDKAIHKKNK